MSERPGPKGKTIATILSNGTSKFGPTTILVSLDGFRADFLDRGLTPTLNSFIAEGVSPKYMLPSFPSVTFPNHYTLVTGLYPESHGMVGNQFWDPDLMEEFHYTDPAAQSMQAKWWSEAEPLWVTATKANIRSAIHMWPGSEARNEIGLAFVDKYNGTEVLAHKLDRVMQFLDLPSEHDPATDNSGESRPQFIAFYVPNVDQDGHRFGPNSTEIRSTIVNVDNMLHDLFAGLQKRNLTDIVNVVIVSDHGMATTSSKRLVQLEDLVDTSQIWPTDGWPLHGLRPKNASNLRPMYEKLSTMAANNPTFDVYLRDENMPAKYHFTNNKRIAPLWIVPKTGWAIVHRRDFDVKEDQGKVFRPKGLHGYDHEHPLMRAIFVARGPAFPHQPNSRLEVFRKFSLCALQCHCIAIYIYVHSYKLLLILPQKTPKSTTSSVTPSVSPRSQTTALCVSRSNPSVYTPMTQHPKNQLFLIRHYLLRNRPLPTCQHFLLPPPSPARSAAMVLIRYPQRRMWMRAATQTVWTRMVTGTSQTSGGAILLTRFRRRRRGCRGFLGTGKMAVQIRRRGWRRSSELYRGVCYILGFEGCTKWRFGW